MAPINGHKTYELRVYDVVYDYKSKVVNITLGLPTLYASQGIGAWQVWFRNFRYGRGTNLQF